jgi:squalene synthase HpnC
MRGMRTMIPTAESELLDMPEVAVRLDERVLRDRASQENFPVASRALPRAVRCHLLAIYGFARVVDDTGDEFSGNRTEALDALDAELDRAYRGTATNPVFVRLAPTLRVLELDDAPFRALIEANRVDQVVTRYETWASLREYCALSANPVGRLVLAVLGAATPERLVWSDDVCTALQLVEHLQDVGEDFTRGRVYLPAEDLDRFGASEADLDSTEASEPLRAVVAYEAARARRLLRGAAPVLSRSLPGRARVAVAGFAGGGLAALDAIARADYDVLATHARPSRVRTVWRAAQVGVAGPVAA